MKAKRDFVTNSSSTSFVVADYRKNTETLLVEYDWGVIDLLKVLRSEKVTSYNDYKYDYGYGKDERVKEALTKGAIIHILYASDNGRGPLEAGFCRTGIEDIKIKGIEVIKGEGGY